VPEIVMTAEPAGGVKFDSDQGFLSVIRRRVDEYFRSTGRRQRDCPQMYLKSAIFLMWLSASYVLLVFVAQTWWQALPLAVALGLAMGAIGLNVQHDAAHHAISRYEWVNRLMALTLDLVGGSSYLWHWKHNVSHHTYVNITGCDVDLEVSFLARLTPHQRWLKIHRWQHFYLWGLYGLMISRWQLFGDFHDLITGRMGGHQFPRPKGWALATFLGGKLVFLALAFGVPMVFHPVWAVLALYLVATTVLGVVMAVVFQLAHAVEPAAFPAPRLAPGRIDNCWAVHQVQTTVNFARRSRLASWLLGGLNFQIEHHLFPRICHVHYPGMSHVVEAAQAVFAMKLRREHFFMKQLQNPLGRSLPLHDTQSGLSRTTLDAGATGGRLQASLRKGHYLRTTTSTGLDGRMLPLPSVPSTEKAW